jgi:hypothetical protein
LKHKTSPFQKRFSQNSTLYIVPQIISKVNGFLINFFKNKVYYGQTKFFSKSIQKKQDCINYSLAFDLNRRA